MIIVAGENYFLRRERVVGKMGKLLRFEPMLPHNRGPTPTLHPENM
jgi:hypothetical protein